MMSIPFFTATAAMLFGCMGARSAATWMAALTVVATLTLFAVHATDPLKLSL